MFALCVDCYSGYKADQRPSRFALRGRCFQVDSVLDQWYSPDATYFRVRAHDGNLYVLRHDQQSDDWSLAAFRSGP